MEKHIDALAGGQACRHAVLRHRYIGLRGKRRYHGKTVGLIVAVNHVCDFWFYLFIYYYFFWGSLKKGDVRTRDVLVEGDDGGEG